MAHHVVTGATGFVGSHLVADLLADSSVDHVYALARPDDERTSYDRVVEAMASAGFPQSSDKLDRLTVIDAELEKPLCGAETLHLPDGEVAFWHLAASLVWRRGQREQSMRTNVHGTRNALALANHLGVDLFAYVSTAYTCGTEGGSIPEELHTPPSFNNVYEETKNAAEHAVAEHQGVRTIILRPSVVIGSSKDYRASGSYTGLYGYISELRKFREMLGDSKDNVRVTVDTAARISFVPVDYVIEDSRAIVQSELKAPRQRVYHVTGTSETSSGEIIDHMLDGLGLTGRLIMTPDELSDLTTLEKFFAKRMAFFTEYVRNERRFVRSDGVTRSVPFREIRKYIDSELAL